MTNVTRILRDLGLNRGRPIGPNVEDNRKSQVVVAKRPRQIVHVDIKKVGKISRTGVVGMSTVEGRQGQMIPVPQDPSKQPRIGYTYLHRRQHPFGVHQSDNETAATAIDFMNNAWLFFAAHGFNRVKQLIADKGSRYRAADFTSSLREARTTAFGPMPKI